MTNPNVTARHARNAIRLLADGVISNIAAAFADDVADHAGEQEACIAALDDMTDGIMAYGLKTWANRADSMISDMQAMLGNPDCPNVIREMLAQYDLNP